VSEEEDLAFVITIRLPPWMMQIINELSVKFGISKSHLVRKALQYYFEVFREQLPIEMQIRVKRKELEAKIQVIKDVKRLYHIPTEVTEYAKDDKELPKPLVDFLLKLREDIVKSYRDFYENVIVPYAEELRKALEKDKDKT
jgi:predicted DNA-binding protein